MVPPPPRARLMTLRADNKITRLRILPGAFLIRGPFCGWSAVSR